MAEGLEQQLAQPDTHALSFEERLGLLVDREATYRENRRLARLLQVAKLRLSACVEDIDYRHPRGLKRAQLATLISGDWLRAHQNLCLVGPTGTGKTWLACALGHQACRLSNSRSAGKGLKIADLAKRVSALEYQSSRIVQRR